MDAELKGYLDNMELRFREYVHDTETRMLREFSQRAVRMESRQKSDHASVEGLDERMSLVEERLDDLEAPPT